MTTINELKDKLKRCEELITRLGELELASAANVSVLNNHKSTNIIGSNTGIAKEILSAGRLID